MAEQITNIQLLIKKLQEKELSQKDIPIIIYAIRDLSFGIGYYGGAIGTGPDGQPLPGFPGGGGGGGGHIIEDEGVELEQRPKINFIGLGVTVTDDVVEEKTTVTIHNADETIGNESLFALVQSMRNLYRY